MNEEVIIKRYFKHLSKNNSNSLNLNDDVFFDKKKKLVISIDNYIEGVHFLNFKRPDLVIRKILRSSISDIFAKGANPNYFFISGSGNKKSFSKKNIKLISTSLSREQKKYNIKLSGGDTTYSSKLSFCITTIGYSAKIVYRNKTKVGDDIYVTGNIGDSYIGLLTLMNKIKINPKYKKYFIDKYYSPKLQSKMSPFLLKFANSSMDISDGLIVDLNRLINNQKYGYLIDFDKVPISNNLKYLIKNKKIKKINCLSKGDDYQILFTASKNKRSYISRLFKKMNQKTSIIGQINSKSKLYLLNNKQYPIKNLKYQGYLHNF